MSVLTAAWYNKNWKTSNKDTGQISSASTQCTYQGHETQPGVEEASAATIGIDKFPPK